MSALTEAGIAVRDHKPGEHRTACPHCTMFKARKGDDALAVRVDPDGSATWLCHRCGWKGGARGDRAARPASRPPLTLRPPPAAPPVSGLTDAAARFLRACSPLAADGPVSRYLARRGCALPENDILEHSAHGHPSGHVGPVMVAVITDPATGERLSLHRTWLKPDGSGKADIAKPRLLWKGLPSRGGVRLFDDAEVTHGLCIAEGIETALAAARGFGPATWACLSAGNIATFPVLDGIECLTIVADNDAPDARGRRAGQDAAEECARRWHAAGREVRIWTAPTEGADFADLAQARAS